MMGFRKPPRVVAQMVQTLIVTDSEDHGSVVPSSYVKARLAGNCSPTIAVAKGNGSVVPELSEDPRFVGSVSSAVAKVDVRIQCIYSEKREKRRFISYFLFERVVLLDCISEIFEMFATTLCKRFA